MKRFFLLKRDERETERGFFFFLGGGGGVGRERQGETNRICIPNTCTYSLVRESFASNKRLP